MDKTFTVQVLTPDGPVFNGLATAVQLPGAEGLFQVLAGHAALISALAAGRVRIDGSSGGPVVYQIGEGLVEVLNDQVVVLAQTVVAV